MEKHSCYILVRNYDRALVYNDNSDNIISFHLKPVSLCYYRPHLPKLYFAYFTWTSFRDPPFEFEFESIEKFRFFYFIGY